MDGQDKQPEARSQLPPELQVVQTGAKLAPASVPVSGVDKPKVEMTDAQIQALLMLNGAQMEADRPKQKLPIGLIVTVIVLLVLLSMVGPLISHVSNTKASTKQSANPSTSSNSQSTTNEVNNEVKQCQHTETALAAC